MKHKVAITGASGFLGSKLLTALATKYDVIALTRTKKSLENVRSVQCDLNEKISSKYFEDSTILYHFAAYVPLSSKEDDFLPSIENNVYATLNLMNAIRGTSIRKVVFSSTAEVYDKIQKMPLNETSLTEPKSNYAITKLEAEEVIRKASKEMGLSYFLLRFTSLYGPGDTSEKAIPSFVRKAIKSEDLEIKGNGHQVRDYLYVDDAVKASFLFAEKEGEGIFNIGSGRKIKIIEVAEEVNNQLGNPSRLKYLPSDEKDFVLSSEKAIKCIGEYSLTSLSKGIKKTIEWNLKEFKH